MSGLMDERREWFRRLRADWFRVMRPIGAWVPWELRDLVELEERTDDRRFWGEGLLVEAPQLGNEHLRNCVVVPTRTSLLQRLPKGGIVAEVGVLHGQFSREILANVSPLELHLIDHKLEPGARDLATKTAATVRLHEGDSATVLNQFPDGHFDWLYVDAQHTYDGVVRDIGVARRKVKPHGLLVFNDYTPWSYVEMQPYGVVAAVNELCLSDGWEIVCLALPAHMYCDVALRRRT
jgi:SAM-dependent methyltransferase